MALQEKLDKQKEMNEKALEELNSKVKSLEEIKKGQKEQEKES